MSAILAIEQASFARDAYPESLFRLYAADRRTLFLVAAAGANIAGYIIARMDAWGAEIVSLAVAPSARHRGIGRALLAAIIRRIRRHMQRGTPRRNMQSVRLMVHQDNSSAREFYRQQGFRSTGRVPEYYEDGGTGIRMRLIVGRRSA